MIQENSVYLLVLVPIFAFLKLVLAKHSSSLEGNLPSGFWLGAAKSLSLFTETCPCVALPAEISDSSSAPFYHLGWSQVGELEEKRQFIALSL